jgi:DNA primase small subunit
MLERAYHVLKPMFIKEVISEAGHGLLASADQWEPFLETMPDAANQIVEKLKNRWSGLEGAKSSPEEKWSELNMHINTVFGRDGKVKRTKQLENKEKERVFAWVTETVFKYTYPRLDINVSKMKNHLLKSPFCVHPKTGRVCIPIRVADIDNFDPFQVPNLAQLMNELDNFEGDATHLKEWQKTSLKDHFEAFEKEFLAPMCKDLRRQAREKAEERAAVTGDF